MKTMKWIRLTAVGAMMASQAAWASTLTLDGTCYALTGNVVIDPQGNITAQSQGLCGGGGDNISPGVLTISPASASITEGEQQTFLIQRTGGTFGPASIDVVIQEISAGSSDYTVSGDCAAGSIHWQDGDGTNKSCVISAVDDTEIENDETLSLTLQNAGGASLGNPSTATLTILDNDSPSASACPPAGPNVTQMALDWSDKSTHTLTWQSGEVLAIAFTTDGDPGRRGDIALGTTTAGAASAVSMAVSRCPGDMTPLDNDARCATARPNLYNSIYYSQGPDPRPWECSLPSDTPLYLNITSDCPQGKTCAAVLKW